ncbi:MAG: hypothetical protein H0V91_08580 [Flavisolibacter sp.]|nr:hypothetical protein [Flavisolibacter sp.]
MITSLIVLLIRRYRKSNPAQFKILAGKAFYASKILAFLAICLLMSFMVKSQERNLVYVVKRNGADIGFINLKQVQTKDQTIYKLQSSVTASILFTFHIKVSEEAVYENGILQSSFVKRLINGSEKSLKNTRLTGSTYVLTKKGSEPKQLSASIRYNILSMYLHEPIAFTNVYSDSFQQFVAIQKIKFNHYKISFPDGNNNEYFYDNGVLAKIKMNNSLFNAEVELKK